MTNYIKLLKKKNDRLHFYHVSISVNVFLYCVEEEDEQNVIFQIKLKGFKV